MESVKDSNDYTIFICYSSKNEEKLVIPLGKTIKAVLELKPFIANLDPRATYLKNKIVPQLDVCWTIILLFTREASMSQWVNQEVGFAAKKWWPSPPKIILVCEKEIKPKAFLAQMDIVHTIDSVDTLKKAQIDDMIYKVMSVLRKEIPKKELHLRIFCNSCRSEIVVVLPNQREIDDKVKKGNRLEINCEKCSKRIKVDPKTLLSCDYA